jgi:putative membrane protein
MSAERTLEAWMRTSASLIGFGFAIVQFFDQFAQMGTVKPASAPVMPHYLGLFLIGIGTAALAVAMWQYKLMLRHLHGEAFLEISGRREKMPGWSPTLSVAVSLCLVGLAAFLIILTQAVMP